MGTRAWIAGFHGVAAIGLSIALSHSNDAPVPSVVQARAAEEARPSDAGADIKEALSGLAQLRSGDDGALPQLLVAAQRCADIHGRPDVLATVQFYAGLTTADRVRGNELEGVFNGLHTEVNTAGTQHIGAVAWREKRASILARLDEVVLASRSAPDFTPAARCLSLRARIFRQRVVDDAEFAEEEKQAWIRTGRHDAREAIALFERAGMLTPQLEALQCEAWFDWASDKWSSAQAGFESVRDLAEFTRRKDYQESAIDGLVQIAQASGDHQETARLLDELAEIQSPQISWKLVSRQAELLLAIDEPARAADFLARNEPASAVDVGAWHLLMKGALTRKGDVAGALLHEKALRASSESGAAPNDAAAELSLAEAELQRGENDAVLRRLESTVLAGSLPPELQAHLARVRGSALLALGRAREAIAVFEIGLAIGNSLEARLLGSVPSRSTSSAMGEVVGLETVALLARARLECGEDGEAARAIEDSQSRSSRSALAGGVPPPLTRLDLEKWAQQYELGFVTWVIGADTSVVVHVARDGAALGATIPIGRKRFEDAIRRLREATIANDAVSAVNMAAEIESVIFPPPIREHIAANARTDLPRLLVCVHGPLWDLPLEVLPMFWGVSARTFVPIALPGLLEPAPGPALVDARNLEWSLAGDPIDVEGQPSLPGLRAELAEIAALHPNPHQFVGAAFDERALEAAIASGRPLHIATHLIVGKAQAASIDARLSHAGFLTSGGGRFDVGDIARAHPQLPIAVLSACETGSGQFVDAQASNGIARTFLECGTRNLLVTSWPVEDGAARRYTQAFHRALRDGHIPSRAAVSARETLRRSGAPSADWAGFRLLGRD